MALETVRVKGYRELSRAARHADKETAKQVRLTFRKVGEIVRVDATGRFDEIDATSAGRFRTRVRQRGVAVEQSLRKTTGLRPDYGSLQMRKALLPALAAKQDEVEEAFEDAIDTVCDHFERRG